MYSTNYLFTYATPYPVMDTSHGKARTFLKNAPVSEAENLPLAPAIGKSGSAIWPDQPQ